MWNTFERDRKQLAQQYIRAWNNEESLARVRSLKDQVAQLIDQLAEEPTPVIKAKCFAYILDNAPVCIHSNDWFGIALEAQGMAQVTDVGCAYQRILQVLTDRKKAELADLLHPSENKDFVSGAQKHLLDEFYIDYNHSTPNWDDIFCYGISGLRQRARQYRDALAEKALLTDKQTAYFEAIDITYSAIIRLFCRYIDALEKHTEPKMLRMKEALENLVTAPPKNTYEALLLAWNYWFLQEQVDCVRVRTMGGLDQLYIRFYKQDLAEGTFTEENIKELFVYFMNKFNAMQVRYQQPMYLGGMNEQGECIVNELSYLLLDAYNILSAPNPKLQAKISKNTPDTFLKAVLWTIRNGNSSISIMNDDNAAASLMGLGVPKEEALTNLMSGCWDYTVKAREVKMVPIRVCLPKILEYTMTGGVCLTTGQQVGCKTETDFGSFDDFLFGL